MAFEKLSFSKDSSSQILDANNKEIKIHSLQLVDVTIYSYDDINLSIYIRATITV